MEFEDKLTQLELSRYASVPVEYMHYLNKLNNERRYRLALAGATYAESVSGFSEDIAMIKCIALDGLQAWDLLSTVTKEYITRYPNIDHFKFYSAVASRGLGHLDEAINICNQINNDSEVYTAALILSDRIGGVHKDLLYTSDKLTSLKYLFYGVERINSNYSQCMQDMFVLTTLGSSPGTYLEFGAADPIIHSNTKILEEFGWNGISVEYNNSEVEKFKSIRSNEIYCCDAREFNYDTVRQSLGSVVDYLQLDLDPATVTLEVLRKCLDSGIRFKVITFEHDAYVYGDQVRSISRKLLTNAGYQLVMSNVGMSKDMPFEDWYIDPELIFPIYPTELATADVLTVKDIFYE